MSDKETRKDINKRYNAKRLLKPKINVITDVPAMTVHQLERLAEVDGSKKEAVLKAINDRYIKIILFMVLFIVTVNTQLPT